METRPTMPHHLDRRSSLRAEQRIPAKHRVIAPTTAMSICLFGILLLTGDEVGGQTFDYHQVRGRLPSQSDIEVHEGESDLTKSGTSRFQSLVSFGPHWSQGAHLLWDGAVGDVFTTDFFVEEAGIYDVKIQFTVAPDYGRFSLDLEDVPISKVVGADSKTQSNDSQVTVDLYGNNVALAPPVWLKSVQLKRGPQTLRMRLMGANSKASMFKNRGYLLGLDYLSLNRLDRPESLPEKSGPKNSETVSENPIKSLTVSEISSHLGQYCFDCHDGSSNESDLDLTAWRRDTDFAQKMEEAQAIRKALKQNEMPPEDADPIPAEIRSRLIRSLDSLIQDHLRESLTIAPVIMRRMNRLEYNNAVRDLLELRGDIYPLPEKTLRPGQPYFNPSSGRFPRSIVVGNRTLGKNQVERQILTGVSPFALDLQAEGGFNNRGEELSVSPILLESFISLGRSIISAPEFDSYCKIQAELFEAPEGLTLAQEVELASGRLSSLMERAFRAPVQETTLRRYVNYFETRCGETGNFTDAMKDVVAAILASPRFLFVRAEETAEGSDVPSSAYPLANRLAFFLWSSIPDRELLELARTGELRQPEVLRQQTERMLSDPKCQALSQNFARQWLRLDQLITAVPDFERFPEYYSRIGCEQWKLGLQSMMEPLLLFESILVEDRSIMLLVDSNYTYRSDELHSWYTDEVPFNRRENRNRFNTGMQSFRRRQLSDRRQGGVLTSTAAMTMTSAPLRTSPIVRGAWVATVFLNQPPPPPPDDIPSIESDDREIEAQGMTLRQRLEQHKINVACASCHSKIDPLGFALENYDAVGRWRDEYSSGLKIDSQGKLLGQYPFSDAVELKDQLLRHPEIFMQAFSEHLISYALGRELEISDEMWVDEIVEQVEADHGQFSSVVHAIVQSPLFLHAPPTKTSEK